MLLIGVLVGIVFSNLAGLLSGRACERRNGAACAVRDHVRPSIAWYDTRRGEMPCLRCGEPVMPRIDMGGHP